MKARHASTSDLRPGFEIPGYRILKRISRGSYGEVWLAEDERSNLRAVKTIWKKWFSDEDPFDQEREGVESCAPFSNHPHLVRIHSMGAQLRSGLYFYIMELADDASGSPVFDPEEYKALTLSRLLRRRDRPPPVEECLEIAIEICAGLNELHRRGLVHRDLKPSNIIFVNGRAKIADVGLVTRVNSERSLVGTEGFIAPEGPGTFQSDIFSLGMLLYEMSTGFERHRFPEIPILMMEAGIRARFLEFNKILLQACHSDPNKRFPTASHMARALKRIHQSKARPGTGPVESLDRSWRSGARIIGWSAAAAMAIGAFMLRDFPGRF